MKKLFLLLLFLCSTQVFAQGAFGSGGDLEPLGPYPIVKQKFIQGGLHVLSDTSLLASYLRDSVMVYQKSDGKFYRYQNNWQEVPTGPSLPFKVNETGDTIFSWGIQYCNGCEAFITGIKAGWTTNNGLLIGRTGSGGQGPYIYHDTRLDIVPFDRSKNNTLTIGSGRLKLGGGLTSAKNNLPESFIQIDTLGIRLQVPYSGTYDFSETSGLYYDPSYFAGGNRLIDSLIANPYAFRVSPDTIRDLKIDEKIAAYNPPWKFPDLTPATYSPGAGSGDTLASFGDAYNPSGKAYIIGANLNSIFGQQGLEFNAGGQSIASYFFNRGANIIGSNSNSENKNSINFLGTTVSFRAFKTGENNGGSGVSIDTLGLSVQAGPIPFTATGFKGLRVTSSDASLDSIRLNLDDYTYLPRVLVSELVEDSLNAYSTVPTFPFAQIYSPTQTHGNLNQGLADSVFKRTVFQNIGGPYYQLRTTEVVQSNNSNEFVSNMTYVDATSNPTTTKKRWLASKSNGVGGTNNIPVTVPFWSFGNDPVGDTALVISAKGLASYSRDLSSFFGDRNLVDGGWVKNIISDSLAAYNPPIPTLAQVTASGAATSTDVSFNNVTFTGNWTDNAESTLTDGQTLVSKSGVMTATDVAETISHTEAINFPSIAAGSFQSTTVTITGVEVGDVIAMTPDKNAFTDNLQFQAWVNGANTVAVQAYNYTGAAIDPVANSFHFKILK